MNISVGVKSISYDVPPRHPFVIPDYMELYKFENEDFDYLGWHNWMRNIGRPLAVFLVVSYFTLILVGKQWMKNRKPYRLRGPLVVWNVALALFSMMVSVRSLPELVYLLGKPGGFHDSICSRDEMNIATVFWIQAMTFSKVVELGDTAFIVLRKQRLILLHWYHHAIVLLCTFFTFPDHDPAQRWFSAVNSFIHAVMYSYYALRAFGVKLPKVLSVAITSFQLLQMFFGTGVTLYAFYAPSMGYNCQVKHANISVGVAMYASFVVLFGNFFYQTYFRKQKTMKKVE